MKRIVFIICLISVVFSSCIRDLEQEGIYDTTILKGRILEKGNNAPIKATIQLVDSLNHAYAEQTSNSEGYFQIPITYKQLASHYSLFIQTDSLYGQQYYTLPSIHLGEKDFDLGTIFFQSPLSPTITLDTITNITATSAILKANVITAGNSSLTAIGVCYSTKINPTTNDLHTTESGGVGAFSSMISNLKENTTYYVRAYATSSVATSYSNQISFTTKDGLPVVTIQTVSSILSTSATTGGNILSDGGFFVTSKGVCYSLSMLPTINNSHTTDGQDTGSFISHLSNLTPNSTYYVRAYARNKAGISYSEQLSFTTLSGLPTTSSTQITSISTTTATCQSTITSDGGFTITSRGICYSTSPNPTTSSSHTTDGTGTGSFISYLTNLQPNTTYYIRTYATNSIGTSYGEEVSFMTK